MPPSGHVRIGPYLPIPELFRELGIEPEGVLSEVGLAAGDFDDPDRAIPVRTRGRLLAACARASGCDHFGLLLGQRRDASALGPVAFLLKHAPDVRTALSELVANFQLHNRMAALYLEVTERVAMLGYETLAPNLEGAAQVNDAAMAFGFKLLQGLCGPDWLPSEVRLRRLRPMEVEDYRRFFKAPVVFGAEQTALIFPAHWLDRKVMLADPALHDHLRRQLTTMRSDEDDDLASQVGRLMLGLLGTKRCSLEELAAALGVHPRTLNRRLRASDTSFREIYEGARHHLAMQLLRDTRSSIQNIALVLNYSGGNAFGRAFTQWEGVPPATWRRRMWTDVDLGAGRR